MIRRLLGGRQKPQRRTSKTQVKKQDNFKGTGNKLKPVDYLVKPSATAKKAAGSSSNYNKKVPTKATTDSKGLVTLSSPKPKAKRKSLADQVKAIKAIRERLAAQGSDGKGKGVTSKESVKEDKAKARTGMGSKKSGAMGRGNKKPKGVWITKTKGTPRI